MKHIISIALILTALLFSLDASALTINGRYAWKGKLGSNISFKLEVEENINGLVVGETTYYRRNGSIRKLPVYGECISEQNGSKTLILDEYDGTKVCGSFYIEQKGAKLISGSWNLNDKQLVMSNMVATTFSLAEGKSRIVPATASNIIGNFKFSYDSGNQSFPEHGGSAQISKSGNTFKWYMCQVTPNIAEGEGKATFNGNTFTGKVGNFHFRAWVYDKLLFVKRLNPEAGPCDDFGAHATLAGIYIRCKK